MNWRTKRRQALYDREKGDREFPICWHCRLEIMTGQAWDIAHKETPAAFGGSAVSLAHRRCNRRHGASIVRPMVTKSNNVRARHTGAFVPIKKLPGGRDDRLRKKLDGRVVLRETGERPGR